MKTIPRKVLDIFTSYYKDLCALETFAWVLILLSALDGFGSFTVELNLMPFFKRGLGLTNIEAGNLFGLAGVALIVMGIPSGLIVDAADVKFSLTLGFITYTACRILLGLSDSKMLSKLIVNFGLTFAACLIGASLKIATGRIREIALQIVCFTLIYWSANVGDVISAYINPMITSNGGIGQFELMFLITALVSFVSAIITMACFRPPLLMVKLRQPPLLESEIEMNAPPKPDEYAYPGVKDIYATTSSSTESSGNELEEANGSEPEPKPRTSVSKKLIQSSTDVLLSRSLWRCMVSATVFMWVRIMFRTQTSILPIYMQNLYGLDVDYSFAVGINPMGIALVLIFYSIFLRNRKNPLSMLFWGTLISALSPLPVILWRDPVSQWPVWLMQIQLTVGEMFYSPILEMFATSLPPENSKGLYMVLAGLPHVLGTFFSGVEAGYLLDTFCPEPVSLNYDYWAFYSCANLWIVITLCSLLSPLLWLIFQSFLLSKEEGRICSRRSKL